MTGKLSACMVKMNTPENCFCWPDDKSDLKWAKLRWETNFHWSDNWVFNANEVCPAPRRHDRPKIRNHWHYRLGSSLLLVKPLGLTSRELGNRNERRPYYDLLQHRHFWHVPKLILTERIWFKVWVICHACRLDLLSTRSLRLTCPVLFLQVGAKSDTVPIKEE